MPKNKKLGLALSGSGYRAAAFHLGTLKKLHELGILSQVDILSAVSGGSIAGAFYCLNKYDFFYFEHSFYQALNTKSLLKKQSRSFKFFKTLFFTVIFLVPAVYFLFTPNGWLSLLLFIFFIAGLINFQSYIFPLNRKVEQALDNYFYKKAVLSDLVSIPELMIGSTNLVTGRNFSFSRAWMEDPSYQQLSNGQAHPLPVEFNSHNFPIARAVMASGSGTFGNNPVQIEKKYFHKSGRDSLQVKPQLVDGGIFDPLGISPLLKAGRNNCSVIISSDAGQQMGQNNNNNNALPGFNLQVIYLSGGSDIENCIPGFINNMEKKLVPEEVIRAHYLHPDWVENPVKYEGELTDYIEEITGYCHIIKPCKAELEIARSVPGGLACLSKEQIDCLIKHAAALTELQVKLYCPGLLN